MAARCPACERMLENQTIWRSWKGAAGNHQLDCPHCGEALELTRKSGILIGVVAFGASLAMLPLFQMLRSEGVGLVWLTLLLTVVISLVTILAYLGLARYQKSTSLSIKSTSFR